MGQGIGLAEPRQDGFLSALGLNMQPGCCTCKKCHFCKHCTCPLLVDPSVAPALQLTCGKQAYTALSPNFTRTSTCHEGPARLIAPAKPHSCFSPVCTNIEHPGAGLQPPSIAGTRGPAANAAVLSFPAAPVTRQLEWEAKVGEEFSGL